MEAPIFFSAVTRSRKTCVNFIFRNLDQANTAAFLTARLSEHKALSATAQHSKAVFRAKVDEGKISKKVDSAIIVY